MNTYFRITAYNPSLDVSFIIDCVNTKNALWEFSADLVAKKCKILEVSKAPQFNDGNIPRATQNGECYILRACGKGKVEKQNGIININGRFYTPNI